MLCPLGGTASDFLFTTKLGRAAPVSHPCCSDMLCLSWTLHKLLEFIQLAGISATGAILVTLFWGSHPKMLTWNSANTRNASIYVFEPLSNENRSKRSTATQKQGWNKAKMTKIKGVGFIIHLWGNRGWVIATISEYCNEVSITWLVHTLVLNYRVSVWGLPLLRSCASHLQH